MQQTYKNIYTRDVPKVTGLKYCIKKCNTAAVTSLVFDIMFVNFNALIINRLCSLCIPVLENMNQKKVRHRLNDVTVTRKSCAIHTLSAMGININQRVLGLQNMVDWVLIQPLLKEHLRRTQFSTDSDIIESIEDFLKL